jgi:hypothetical protein
MRWLNKLGLAIAGALLATAAPALADVTMDFSGSVDLSGVGGAASNTFSGSVTWDPTVSPTSTGSLFPGTFYQYAPVSESLTFDSDDVTSVIPPYLQLDFVPGAADIFLAFQLLPSLTLDPSSHVIDIALDWIGPSNMFSSARLPENLDFLSSVSTPESRFFTTSKNPDFYCDYGCTLTLGSLAGTAPVPEPATLTLTALLTGVLAGYRRRKKN